MGLPDFSPETREAHFEDPKWAKPWGGVAPPLHKLPNGELVVDWARYRKEAPDAEAFLKERYPDWQQDPKAGFVIAKVWRKADHPNMRLLPKNAPRAVKALYRADVQLALLRGSYDTEPAFEAWAAYCAVVCGQAHKCANGAPDTAYNDLPVSAAPSGEASAPLENRVGSTTDTSD